MNFFIRRPIFAMALALFITAVGAISLFQLPISQYPPIAPPQVRVTANYIGAPAKVVASAVTRPLEEQLNGAEGMAYMSSTSTNSGDSTIEMTFDVGEDQSIAQVEALTRSNQAVSSLPSEVNQTGLLISKASGNFVLMVSLTSPDGTHDLTFLQNYADIHVSARLARIPGVASASIFGLRRYAMRIWLDTTKLGGLKLTASDIADAVREQNQQVAAGSLGAAPSGAEQVFQYQLDVPGRLSSAEAFEDIIIRIDPDGRVLRLKDIATVELGVDDYTSSTSLNGAPAANIAISQLADGNALEIADAVQAAMQQLAIHFPPDMTWGIHHDTTRFIKASTRQVIATLVQTTLLVVLVVLLFLRSWRSTLIPAVAIPVSLIGTMTFLLALGFSLNMFTLLGLIVAVALVVDDAIIVVDNINRHLTDRGTDSYQATASALAEVRRPVIATTLVLLAVFFPAAFIPGITGQLYNQFALTIAIAVGISGLVSLSLSPALSVILLRPHSPSSEPALLRRLNQVFAGLARGYASGVRAIIGLWPIVITVAIGLTIWAWLLYSNLPTAFVPPEDQGYLIVATRLPAAATPDRTRQVAKQVQTVLNDTPGVDWTIQVTGFDLLSGVKQPYASFAIPVLAPWSKRASPALQIDAIVDRIQTRVDGIPGAEVIVFNAPPIPGLGSTGGFSLELQDLDDRGLDALNDATTELIKAARLRPEVRGLTTTFDPDVPQRLVEIDRLKVKALNVSLDAVFETLQINFGSLYVNQFEKFGRLYRVYLQADAEQRSSEADLLRLMVRSGSGDMIRMDAFVDLSPAAGPYTISHYNEYTAARINGKAAPGYSLGQAVAAMDQTAAISLPEGFSHAWTGLVYQQQRFGNMAPMVFGLSLVFVFLILAALYESWLMPTAILLAVPLGMLGALGVLALRGDALDVYGQIGLVMLIGIVAKNSILIVEFARSRRRAGADIVTAATEAARVRLRPILMTAIAFIVGLLPMVLASGPGAGASRSLGTTVVSGLGLATVLVILVPVFYFMVERWSDWLQQRRAAARSSRDERPRKSHD